MIYKLTAHADLKYKLREPPSPKDGYLILKGQSIRILGSALSILHLRLLSGRTPTIKDYQLDPLS